MGKYRRLNMEDKKLRPRNMFISHMNDAGDTLMLGQINLYIEPPKRPEKPKIIIIQSSKHRNLSEELF